VNGANCRALPDIGHQLDFGWIVCNPNDFVIPRSLEIKVVCYACYEILDTPRNWELV
jgi:hypothetical protein